jgi:hypothetical protein
MTCFRAPLVSTMYAWPSALVKNLPYLYFHLANGGEFVWMPLITFGLTCATYATMFTNAIVDVASAIRWFNYCANQGFCYS